MAKQLIIGSITKLEEVLDLVTDPEKYVKYLQDLKEAHALVVEKLDWVKTKEEADRHLSNAYEQADILAKEEKKTLDKLELAKQDLHEKQVQTHIKLSAEQAEIDKRWEAVKAFEKEYNKNAADFAAYEKETRAKLNAEQILVESLKVELTKLVEEAQEKRQKAEALLKTL